MADEFFTAVVGQAKLRRCTSSEHFSVDGTPLPQEHDTAAILCFAGHLRMENPTGLIIGAESTIADGYAERANAIEMLGRLPSRANGARWPLTRPTTSKVRGQCPGVDN